MTRVALWVATVSGAGYAPKAPGTVGSAVGVVIYFLTWHWPLPWQIALLAVIVVAGAYASTLTERHLGREDPGEVVIDEVAGQLVTLVATGANWRGAVLGFLLFRAFDITKPWPANKLEALHGGAGIMADDVMAGLYANAALQIGVRWLPGLIG